MSGDVDDVVGATHDPQISVVISVTSVGRLVIPGIRAEIRFEIRVIVVPQRRQTTRRQRQLDRDVADLVIGHFDAFIIEYTYVITGYGSSTRTGFYRKQFKTNAIGADGPTSFRLPPMIDHRHV